MSERPSPIATAPEGDCHAEWKKAAAPPAAAVELATVRDRLAASRGPRFWSGLEQVAGSAEFEEMLHREFPRFAAEWPEGVSRRNFLRLSAASLGLAGLTACTRQPIEKIVPYVKQPEEVLPGRPLFFATAAVVGGYATGVLAESHEGRPTKLEGNPEHPASLGASDAVTQASVLNLYDPDRSQSVTQLGRIASWESFTGALMAAMGAQSGKEGAGLRLLTGPVTGPTEAALLAQLLTDYPRATWHRWDPLGADNARRGLESAFGAPRAARFDLSRADVVVALDSDFLHAGPGAVRYALDFAAQRRLDAESTSMNRLYAAEATPSVTGTMADHRLAVRPSALPGVVVALAAKVGVPGVAAPVALDAKAERFVDAVARDLAAHGGRSLVVAGEPLPAAAHALVAAINETLGNVGATVDYTDPVEAAPVDGAESLAELVRALRADEVDLLVVSGVNPAYDAPADLDFAAAINRDGVLRVHHGLFADETAELCQWHVPATHELESWGDARAFDGTTTLVQPLIEPLYGGKSSIELWSALLGRPATTGYDLLQEHWQQTEMAALSFADEFRRALHDGVVAGSALPAAESTLLPEAAAAAARELAAATPATGFELALRPDPSVLDGRFANNGWLQELPKPITKLTWDNALLLAPRTAEQLGVYNEDLVSVTADGRSVTAPAWILPGQPEGVGTLHLGYGRRRAGRVADGLGVAASGLQTTSKRWNLRDVDFAKAGGKQQLACTQGHYSIQGWLEEETVEAEKRHVVRAGTFEEFRANPEFARELAHEGVDPEASLMPGHDYSQGNAWAMTIDLAACNGCNACMVACQAENNIPVIGKEQVRRGREMHWIRVDRYFQGGLDEPEAIVSQPVPCMQCEQAPCEVVCPVAATTHSEEGLNDMVYNRCVGTRYCLNNCPYKVRRFNFLLYQDWETPQLKLQRNPDVTVRSRGVMEKCTYCVQRINRARIAAEREARPIADGEIRTACQQACPSHAIVFGNQNDPEARISESKKNPRNYSLLEELGTRPRTTYLAMVKNPNPELAG